MNILYLTISYSDNKNGLYQNLVESLQKYGHEITIVRSRYDINETSYFNVNDSLKFLNVKTSNPFTNNLIKKGLSQISLAFKFKNAIKKYLYNEKYDLILYATPPVTLANVVKYCKNKFKAKTFLMLKDIFPQNAVDLDMMKKGSLIYKYFRKQECEYYKHSDIIGCMSQGNIDYLLSNNPNIKSENVILFPNSIKIEEVNDSTFHNDKTVFMFGGNLGIPQNIDFLLKVIRKLNNYDKAEFIIIGDGSETNKIIDFMKNEKLSNFIYKPILPQSEYELQLKTCDVGLISLDPRFTIPNIPSRFQTYLKLKKPVLAITDDKTDLKDMIEDNDCGWWCLADNVDNVVKQIKQICEDKKSQIIKGQKGNIYLKANFNVDDNAKVIDKFIKIVN